MYAKRIIPCLDVKEGRVVKGVNFVNLIDAGDPVECAKVYDKAGADELVFLDITASSDARETVVDMVEAVAKQVFIPFTVGGRKKPRSLAQVRYCLQVWIVTVRKPDTILNLQDVFRKMQKYLL